MYRIKLIDGSYKEITKEQYKVITSILNGDREPENEAQERYILTIEDVIEDVDTKYPHKALIKAHLHDLSALKNKEYCKKWVENYLNNLKQNS